jgi:cobalt-zinc-cadmium efflux system outer membrane protein
MERTHGYRQIIPLRGQPFAVHGSESVNSCVRSRSSRFFTNYLSLLTLCSSLALAPSLAARQQDAFKPIQESARTRTGFAVTWEREQQAQEQTLMAVRRLLQAPLTATAAAQIALLNNQGLQATFEEIGLAQADLIDARTVPNPRLDISARFPNNPVDVTDISGGIAQDFLSILMIPLKTKVAKDRLTAAQLRVANEVTRLVAETKSTVYDLEAAQEILVRLKIEQAAQATSLDLIQRLHQAGNITDLQLIQQQAEYSASRLEIAQQEEEIRTLREKLNRLMGLWGADTDWKVESKVPDVPKDNFSIRGLETLAITQRYDLAGAKAELQSRLRALGLIKSFRWIGALDFGVQTEREPEGETITGPSLSIELPIFNQNQANVARGEAQLRQAYDNFKRQAVEIRSEVRELRGKVLSSRDMAQFYKDDLVPIRRQARDQMQLQYNAMIVGPLELFTARQREIAAERAYVEAKRDYWVDRAELEQTVGGSLSARTQIVSKNPVSNKP